MLICQIACVATNGVIGKDQGLPWHLPTDLSFFRLATENHPLIMGRRTFESLPRVLEGRPHIVMSRSMSRLLHGQVVQSLDAAITAAQQVRQKNPMAFVIGGQSVFRSAMPRCHYLLLTRLKKDYDGDSFFPTIPEYYSIEGQDETSDDRYVRYIYRNTRIDANLAKLPERLLSHFRLDCQLA